MALCQLKALATVKHADSLKPALIHLSSVRRFFMTVPAGDFRVVRDQELKLNRRRPGTGVQACANAVLQRNNQTRDSAAKGICRQHRPTTIFNIAHPSATETFKSCGASMDTYCYVGCLRQFNHRTDVICRNLWKREGCFNLRCTHPKAPFPTITKLFDDGLTVSRVKKEINSVCTVTFVSWPTIIDKQPDSYNDSGTTLLAGFRPGMNCEARRRIFFFWNRKQQYTLPDTPSDQLESYEEVELNRPKTPKLDKYIRPDRAPEPGDLRREDFHQFMRGTPTRFTYEMRTFLFGWFFVFWILGLMYATFQIMKPDDFEWVEEERRRLENAKRKLIKLGAVTQNSPTPTATDNVPEPSSNS